MCCSNTLLFAPASCRIRNTHLAQEDLANPIVHVAICLIIVIAHMNICIIQVKIHVLIKWSYSPPSNIVVLSLECVVCFEHVVQALPNTCLFLVTFFRSTPYHIPLKYMCLNHCYVVFRHIHLEGRQLTTFLIMISIFKWHVV